MSTKMMKKSNLKSSKIKMKWRAITLPLLVILSCIQRNNPWDPVNYNNNPNAVQYQDSLIAAHLQAKADLDSLMLLADSLKKLAISADTQITQKTTLADSVKVKNSLAITKNIVTISKDSVLDTLQKKSCTSLKTPLDTLQRIDTLHFATDFVLAGVSAQGLYLAGDSIAKIFNAQFSPDTIISAAELSALKSATESDAALFQTLVQKRDSINGVFDSVNAPFAIANKTLANENQKIAVFNATVQTTYPCNFPLTNADTIIKSIPLLKPGDTLVIAPGAFTFNTAFNLSGISGTPAVHIVIMGDAQGGTVFSGSQNSPIAQIDIATQYVDFVNITFSGGLNSGVTVLDNSGPVTFQNCAFINNRGDGIHVLDSYIEMTSCRFLNNDSNGVFLQNSQAVVQNVLIAQNKKNGIFFAGLGINGVPDTAIIINATISDNDSDGVFQQGGFSYVSIAKSLVTFNKRIGIHRENQITANAPLFLSSSDLYMNAQQNVASLPPFDSLQFLSEDPLYVNKANYNYSIGPASSVPDSLGYKAQ